LSNVYGPKVRNTIDITPTKISYILNNVPGLNRAGVEDIIQNILDEVLKKTMSDLFVWIVKYVPKRTGQLQDSLLSNLESSKSQNFIAVLRYGTQLDYVKYVTRYKTENVRHNGEIGYAYYNGYGGGTRKHPMRPSPARILLFDPQAIGGFWGQMKMYAKQRMQLHLRDAIRNQTSAAGVKAKPFSDQMKVA